MQEYTGWVQSGELQRRAAGNNDLLTGLRGKGRDGWCVEGHNWACSSPAIPWHGLRGAVMGWYLPMLVVDEGQMESGGVRVAVRYAVMIKRVAVGRTAG